MAKFVCSICGYTYEGNEAPGRCPLCKSPSSQFTLEEIADEIDAQNVDNNIGGKDGYSIGQSETAIQESLKDQDPAIVSVENNLNKEETVKSTYIPESALCSEDDEKIILSFGSASFQAVKWYQENHSCGLKEAKDVVDYVFKKQKKTSTENNSFINDEHVVNVDDSQNHGNKKTYMIIIGVVALLFLIVGLFSNNSSPSEHNDGVAVNDSVANVDSVEVDIMSAEYITKYLEETLNNAINEKEKRAVEKYFTKEFIKLYKDVDEFDTRTIEPGTLGFWNFDFWTGGQEDGELQNVKVLEVNERTGNSAVAIVQYQIKLGNYDEMKVSKEFTLLFEGGEWRIDDFDNYKWRFENYLETSIKQQIEETDSVFADTCAVAE